MDINLNFKTNFLDKSIKTLDIVGDFDECPYCNTSFLGEDIYQHFLERYAADPNYKYFVTKERIIETVKHYPKLYADFPIEDLDSMSFIEMNALWTARSYGWTKENPKCFKHTLMGVEIQGVYDGVLFWQCARCNTYWKRFEWSDLSIVEKWKENETISNNSKD